MFATSFALSLLCLVRAWTNVAGDVSRQTAQARATLAIPMGNVQWRQRHVVPAGRVNRAIPTSHGVAVWTTTQGAKGTPASMVRGSTAPGTTPCVVTLAALSDLGSVTLCNGRAWVNVGHKVLSVDENDCSNPRESETLVGDVVSPTNATTRTAQPSAAVCVSREVEGMNTSFVVVPTMDSVWSIDASTMETSWRTRLEPNATVPMFGFAPAQCGDVVYQTALVGHDAILYGLSAWSGAVLFRTVVTISPNATNPMVTRPVVSDGCTLIAVGMSDRVALFNATGALLNNGKRHGMCGAQSIVLQEAGVRGETDDVLVITASDQTYGLDASVATMCFALHGAVAMRVTQGGLSSDAPEWSFEGPEMSDVDLVVSNDGNVFWCQGGVMYGARPNNPLYIAVSLFNGCTGASISADGELVARLQDGIAVYTVETATTTAVRTTTLPGTTSGAAPSTEIERERACMVEMLHCMTEHCQPYVNQTFDNMTCAGLACKMACVWRTTPSLHCGDISSLACNAGTVIDVPCDFDCHPHTATFTPSTTHHDSDGTTTTVHDAPGTILPAPSLGPTTHDMTPVIIVCSIVAVIGIGGIVFYLAHQKKKGDNRYVLLQLDEEDDEEAKLLP